MPVGICQSWAEAELTVGMNFQLISTLPFHSPPQRQIHSTLGWPHTAGLAVCKPPSARAAFALINISSVSRRVPFVLANYFIIIPCSPTVCLLAVCSTSPRARWQTCFAISPMGSWAAAISLSPSLLLISKVSLEELLLHGTSRGRFWMSTFAQGGDYGTALCVPVLVTIKPVNCLQGREGNPYHQLLDRGVLLRLPA